MPVPDSIQKFMNDCATCRYGLLSCPVQGVVHDLFNQNQLSSPVTTGLTKDGSCRMKALNPAHFSIDPGQIDLFGGQSGKP